MTWAAIKYFYCVNLRPNVKRWEESVQQFIKAGIPWVERLVVDEPEDNRYLGFNRSLYSAIKKGYETGCTFCVFEDDIAFTPQFAKVEQAMNELPEGWDLLYLGANIIGSDVVVWDMPTRYSGTLVTLPNAWQTHAIVYSQKGAKYILDNFDPETFPVLDEWLRLHIMTQGRTFLIDPMICYQRPGYSDLWQVTADYTGCHKQGNAYLMKI